MLAASAWAGEDLKTFRHERDLTTESQAVYDEEPNCFHANEWQVDLFATYADVIHNHHWNDGFGGGVGFNYFFTENWGAGLEGYWWDGDKPDSAVLHNPGMNIFFRYPIQEWCLAPYAFIGPDGHLDGEKEVGGHAGLGLEWRFWEHVGAFIDGRYNLTSGDDIALARAGIRFNF
ncbi:MAG: outer membrane beta-barrel protein [Verrucomicrobiae bacterium]|nr:outer membrane beta-barrel protein [Verrucomicrobiae bacterium]